MSRGILTVAAIGGVLAASFVAVFIEREAVWRLEVILSAVSGTASLLTLAIAVLLFGKFGAEQETLQRQLAAVEKLLDSFRRFNLMFAGKSAGIRVDGMNPNLSVYVTERFYEMRIGITPTLAGLLGELSKHHGDTFLPATIADALVPLECSVVTRSADPIPSDDLLIPIPESIVDVMGDEMNQERLTLFRLVSALDGVHDAIEAWYSEVSSLDLGLNLRPRYRSRKDPA